MTKFTDLIKSAILKLNNPRQFIATVGLFSSLAFSLASGSISIALADEGAFDGNSAFLAVQPMILEEKENSNIMWQNNIFALANQRDPALLVAVKAPAVIKSGVVTVTAYSSTPEQTDDSPFITANGTYVHDGVIATNFLPFGTKVRFPEYSGDKIYTVEDRMAKKNSHKIDIWMASYGQARQFGVQQLEFEVVQ